MLFTFIDLFCYINIERSDKMPSVIIHRCVSKRVLDKTNLYTNENDKYFYDIGSLTPDSWRNTKRFKDSLLPKKEKRKYSHFSNDGEFIENYDIFYNKYKKYLDEKNPFMVGYLVHLITDNFWRYDMFYKSFFPDGSIKMIDMSIMNADKHEKKDLLNKETKKVSRELGKYYELVLLRHITEEETSTFPVMDEIEYDGINDSIDYNNFEIEFEDNSNYELQVFSKEDFIKGVERCSNYIIDRLMEYNIIKR